MKIEHVAIWTRQIETLRAFYETYFDAQAGELYTNPRKGFRSYFLRFNGGARLELMQMDSIPLSRNDPREQFTGLIHLALAAGSPEAVDALARRLARDGYPLLDGPRTTGDGYYEAAVLDPDGNRIEITV